jgi:GT2 family glycosyltransferase
MPMSSSARPSGGDSDLAPAVVAVVLNYCGESDTTACLQTLLASRYDALTVLLVDNASPDGSGERLHARFAEVPYLPVAANGGYASGNNRGIEWALARGAEYVLLLNDDTEIAPDCIARLVRAAQETDAAAAAPQIVYHDDPEIVWYAGGALSVTRVVAKHFLQDERVDPTQTRMAVNFVCGCCCLIRADVLRAVGGFDESFFAYVEDLELSLRLSRAGYGMVYEPAALVMHRIGRGTPPTPAQIRLRDRNRRRVVAKHYDAVERIRFGLWFYPTRMLHLMRYVAQGRWPEARATLDGAFQPLRLA